MEQPKSRMSGQSLPEILQDARLARQAHEGMPPYGKGKEV